ncbi:MAG: YdcF family protein [Clostridia bacterium]
MKVLVVLGNRLRDDATMSEYLKGRLDKTIEVAADFDKIVLSGGLANKKAGITEAAAMNEYLHKSGISADKILLETQSLTTKQNAKFVSPIIKQFGEIEVTILSSAYHINRKFKNPIKYFTFYLKCAVKSIIA